MQHNIRYVLFILQYVCFKGTFYKGVYYVYFSWQLCCVWIVCILLSVCLHIKWNTYINKKEFVYIVHVFSKNKTLSIKGYLDSGNTCLYKGIPIIFIDELYKGYFIQHTYTYYQIQGVSDGVLNKIYKSEIAINHHKKRWIYICFSKQLSLPYGCECLLNIEM